MKVGDLICYNGAGQRKHSLGMILATKQAVDIYSGSQTQLRVHWLKRGKFLPKDFHNLRYGMENQSDWSDYQNMKKSDHPCLWHEKGDWFEVINEAR